jgi:hypothetical protein
MEATVTEDACRQEILGTLELDRQEGLEHITFARGERPCHPSLAAHIRRTLMPRSARSMSGRVVPTLDRCPKPSFTEGEAAANR